LIFFFRCFFFFTSFSCPHARVNSLFPPLSPPSALVPPPSPFCLCVSLPVIVTYSFFHPEGHLYHWWFRSARPLSPFCGNITTIPCRSPPLVSYAPPTFLSSNRQLLVLNLRHMLSFLNFDCLGGAFRCVILFSSLPPPQLAWFPPFLVRLLFLYHS